MASLTHLGRQCDCQMSPIRRDRNYGSIGAQDGRPAIHPDRRRAAFVGQGRVRYNRVLVMIEQRVNVAGVGVSPTNIPEAVAAISGWIERGEKQYVCVTSVHGVVESQHDPALKAIHNHSGLTVPDGMPLVWLSRWAGHAEVDRVYGPELMLAVCARTAQAGYRHFFYGGAPGVADNLAQRLAQRFPGLTACGSYSPPFRRLAPEEDAAEVALINAAQPDIVWVGLSTPKQERWMGGHIGRIAAPVLIGVGAAFDFHTERVKQAPTWMQRRGLEWLFRLNQEPRRLWRRYLLGHPQFLWHLLLQQSGLRTYPLVH